MILRNFLDISYFPHIFRNLKCFCIDCGLRIEAFYIYIYIYIVAKCRCCNTEVFPKSDVFMSTGQKFLALKTLQDIDTKPSVLKSCVVKICDS